MKTSVIIIRGPLGVGKTTISRILAERMGAKYISIDKLLADAKLDRIDPKTRSIPLANFLAVQEDILPEMDSLLERQSIVIDGNFYYREQIDFFARNFKFNLFVITLKAKLETCVDRDKKRASARVSLNGNISYGRKATEEIYALVSKFDEGFVVDTEGKARDFIVEMIQKSARRK